MWIIFDLIIIAIIAFYVFLSAKHGFVQTVIEFIGFGLAIYFAFIIGGAIAQPVYDNTMKPEIIESVKASVEKSGEANIDTAVDKAWGALPGYVVTVADSVNITSDNLKNSINGEIKESNISHIIAEKTEETIARPIAIPLVKTLIAVPVFLVLMLLVKILARVIGKMFNFSLVGKLNRLLGGILGFGKGVVIAITVAIVTTTIISLTKDGFLFFTMENVNNSLLFSLLANLSPIL